MSVYICTVIVDECSKYYLEKSLLYVSILRVCLVGLKIFYRQENIFKINSKYQKYFLV